MMQLLATVLAVLTMPGTIELIVVTSGACLPNRRRPPRDGALRLAILVPAHDEEAGIARTVQSVLASAADVPVIVVADNCTDATAERARAAGARVLVRTEPDRRGKPHALNFAYDTLRPEALDAIAVIDADTVVAPNFVPVLRAVLAAGADVVQAPYGVLNANASVRTTLQHVAFMAMNLLRPRGRAGWGLSVGILGNGFAFRREVMKRVPFRVNSIAEDLHYHLDLVQAGYRVELLPDTWVRADMPVGGSGFRSQRARWEGGRFRIMRMEAPVLLGKLATGHLTVLEPLLDLLTLPLAFHVVLVLAALLLGSGPPRILAAVGLATVLLHVAVALVLGRAGWREVGVLALAPIYVFWKLLQVPAILLASRKRVEWVRTERDPPAS